MLLDSTRLEPAPSTNYQDIRDTVFDQLASTLFQSLPRRDQRRKGAEYLCGLLQTAGRKSVRNIAATSASSATEQSLHHFISDSTWDWRPMRQALARYVVSSIAVQAWVLRPMTIVKTGCHSVGVSRRFCADVGQSRNVQQSVGLWAVGQDVSSPINWRLHLTSAWLQDNHRRRSVEIPDEERLESLGECAAPDLPRRHGMGGFAGSAGGIRRARHRCRADPRAAPCRRRPLRGAGSEQLCTDTGGSGTARACRRQPFGAGDHGVCAQQSLSGQPSGLRAIARTATSTRPGSPPRSECGCLVRSGRESNLGRASCCWSARADSVAAGRPSCG